MSSLTPEEIREVEMYYQNKVYNPPLTPEQRHKHKIFLLKKRIIATDKIIRAYYAHSARVKDKLEESQRTQEEINSVIAEFVKLFEQTEVKLPLKNVAKNHDVHGTAEPMETDNASALPPDCKSEKALAALQKQIDDLENDKAILAKLIRDMQAENKRELEKKANEEESARPTVAGVKRRHP